jgi:hypothetical protein
MHGVSFFASCFTKYCYMFCSFWNCLYFFYYSWNRDYDEVLAADGGTAGRDGFFTVLGITAVNSIGNVWSCIVLSVCLLCLGITAARRITRVWSCIAGTFSAGREC